MGTNRIVTNKKEKNNNNEMKHTYLKYTKFVVVLFVLCCIYACNNKPAAFSYCSTPIEGWELGDTLKYHVDSIPTTDNYQLSLGIRTSSATSYPFISLWLVVKQHWHNPEQIITDTIKCQLTNERGDKQGNGVSLFQYDQRIKDMPLKQGSWAEISIYHIMRSEIIPGISDIGIKLQKTS